MTIRHHILAVLGVYLSYLHVGLNSDAIIGSSDSYLILPLVICYLLSQPNPCYSISITASNGLFDPDF